MLAALRRFRFTEFQLLVVPSLMAIVGLLTVFLNRTGSAQWTWSDIWISLAYVVLLFGITGWLSLSGFKGDQVLFPIVAMLVGLGLLIMQRLQPVLEAKGGAWATLAQRQLIYLALGLGLFWGMMTFVRSLDWLRRYKYTWAFAGLALMAVTIVLGREEYGARSWLDLGIVTVQPDEIVKLILVVFMAGYLDEHRAAIGSTYRLGPLSLPPIPYLLPMGLMWLMAVATVVLQNNLGSALLFFGIFLVMLYVATGRQVYVVVGLASFAVAVYIAYQLFGRIGDRVQNWIDPWADPWVLGNQQIQSDYAMAAGRMFGVGLGNGFPQFIPVVETDYVFAVIGEELGFLGTMGVLCLYLLLVGRGFLIALRAEDGFARLLAAGLTTILALQTLIILGGVVRLIPLTGVTLPFISAGGSSLLTNFIIVALLLRTSDPEWRRG
ncbi:MAG: FtsW/RodA/SpoVE family cell cycle protein [Sphaerobacter sp.]|nr:FtsW/RodA/SpoVE family cell cycle protein [Sphaerobacter sp.]